MNKYVNKAVLFRLVFLFVLLVVISSTVSAQTVVWEMKPAKYDKIEVVGKNLYKVIKNNKIGLINADGTEVVEPNCDEITAFYEQKALLLRREDQGERIVGCLTSDGVFNKFFKNYYTLTGQKFYSDGVISVTNEKGEKGYIDEKGNSIAWLYKKYSIIKPFTEGFAAVKDPKNGYRLINKNGNEMKFRFSDGVGCPISYLTNVYKGVAYAKGENGNFYTCDMNKNAGKLSETKKPANLSLDYLSRLASLTGQSKTVPYDRSMKYVGFKEIATSESNGKFGYLKGAKQILPYQLQSATPFIDGYAVVELNGKKGILRYVSGESFNVELPSGPIMYSADKIVECYFHFSIPTVWKNKITVELRGENGNPIRLDNNGNRYTFSLKAKELHQSLTFTALGEDLKLCETEMSFRFQKESEPEQKVIHKEKNNETKTKTKTKKVGDKICPTCKKPIRLCNREGRH